MLQVSKTAMIIIIKVNQQKTRLTIAYIYLLYTNCGNSLYFIALLCSVELGQRLLHDLQLNKIQAFTSKVDIPVQRKPNMLMFKTTARQNCQIIICMFQMTQ